MNTCLRIQIVINFNWRFRFSPIRHLHETMSFSASLPKFKASTFYPRLMLDYHASIPQSLS